MWKHCIFLYISIIIFCSCYYWGSQKFKILTVYSWMKWKVAYVTKLLWTYAFMHACIICSLQILLILLILKKYESSIYIVFYLKERKWFIQELGKPALFCLKSIHLEYPLVEFTVWTWWLSTSFLMGSLLNSIITTMHFLRWACCAVLIDLNNYHFGPLC